MSAAAGRQGAPPPVPPLALVALGSNEGDSASRVRAAAAALAQRAGSGFRLSPLYRTRPVDCAPGTRDFVNAVAAFVARDGETPESLLDHLQALEAAAGRAARRPRNAPRPLDADLILFGDACRDSARLVLPHPRALARAFVLRPAADVAADVAWPGLGRSIAALLADLADDGGVRRM